MPEPEQPDFSFDLPPLREPARATRTPAPATTTTTVPAWLVAVLLFAVATLMLRNAGLLPGFSSRASTEPRTVTPRGDLAADEQSNIELFRKASPCVVHIETLTCQTDDDIALTGWCIEPPTPRATIALFHGMRLHRGD